MQEKRKYTRKSIDLRAWAVLPSRQRLKVKMIEISPGGTRFLSPLTPEISSEVELQFSLPSDQVTHEISVKTNVRHTYKVHAMPNIPPDYRYVVGVKFTNLDEDDQAILERFLMEM